MFNLFACVQRAGVQLQRRSIFIYKQAVSNAWHSSSEVRCASDVVRVCVSGLVHSVVDWLGSIDHRWGTQA